MRLKDYQSGALDTLSAYLRALGAEHDKVASDLAALEKIPEPTRSNMRKLMGDPVAGAWGEAQKQGLPASPDGWRPLKDGIGRSIPHVCLKLPTGGGKTLLAAHGLDRILVSYFRQTTGLVLWIVPSEAIYTQTRAQLADRGHPIRQTLDRASGGAVKVLEKLDGFTRADVEQKLCVLLLMLQSTGKENKESLKVFREAGRYGSFFPQDDPTARGGSESVEVQVRMREAFRGKRIMVPRVLHREGKKKYRDLDYEADVLACVDFEALSYRKAESFNVVPYDVGKQQTVAVDIAAGDEFELAATADAGVRIVDQPLDRPGLVRRMLDVVPNPWQGARILDEALAALRKRARDEAIIAARLTLVEDIKLDVQAQVEAAAERIFRDKVKSGDIVFKLLAAPLDELNFTFLEQYTAHIALGDARTPLFHANGNALDRALYDKVYKKHFNGFEEQVALYLDGRDAVTWWWRIAARRDWGLQGWLKNRVYPDFLVRLDTHKQTARLLVLETKGKHMEGSADTTFKERFFRLLEEAYTIGKEAGELELFADAPDAMRFRILLQEEAWQNRVEAALA